MKKLTSLLLLAVIIATGCASTMLKQNDEITIEYQAITRGSNREVILKKDSMEVRNLTDSSKAFIASLTKEQWEGFVKELDKIELEKIAELKAPSEKRFYDGAAIGTFTAIINGTKYRSSSFDHGNPPAEIAVIVSKMLDVSGLDKGRD